VEPNYKRHLPAFLPDRLGCGVFGGSLVQPILTRAKIRFSVKLTEARKQELMLNDQQTIQQAFWSPRLRWQGAFVHDDCNDADLGCRLHT